MTNRIGSALLCLVAVVLAGVLAGCDNSSAPATGGTKSGADAAAGKTTKVSLALNWVPEPEFGGWYDAQVNGGFAKNGLEVTIQKGGSGAPTIQSVAAKQFEFGISSAEELIVQKSKGADVVALFALYQKSPRAILTGKKRGAKSIADVLKSGTIAVEPDATFFKYLKKKYSVTGDLKVVPYSGGLPYMAADDFSQQCYYFSEPLTARAKGEYPAVFLVSDEGYNPYDSIVITSGDYLKNNPEVVKAFVKATKEGWESYIKDPTAANTEMAKLNSEMDAKTFKDAAAIQNDLIVTPETKEKGIGLMTVENWDATSKQLVDLGIVTSAPKAADLFVDLR